jgi:hypothetical protein
MIIDLGNTPHGSTHVDEHGTFFKTDGMHWHKFVAGGVWESCPPPTWRHDLVCPVPRPEHVKCIADTDADNEGKSWCGRWVKHEFHFTDVDHAAICGRNEDRLAACHECTELIAKALANGQEEGK